jgi:DNA repair exonuclease SbcCD ATPase subunit
MADSVKITRLQVLDELRSQLFVFQTKARRALDDVQDEIKRTRVWLQNDIWAHWEGQVKRRQKVLDQMNAELMSARMSEFVDNPTMQQMQVRKARRALEEAQAKLARVKAWNRDFDRQADPLHRRLESLTHYLDNDIPRAAAWLHQAMTTLESYQEIRLDEGS